MKKVILATALILSGCTATTLTSTWRDPSFQPSAPKKAIVIAVLKNGTVRRNVEDAFVKELQQEGLAGVASYTFMPDQKMDKEVVVQEVNRIGADLIIVTALVDRKTTETYIPPTAGTVPSASAGFYGYYSSRMETAYMPGYTLKSDEAISELRAFDAASQKLVWTAMASTLIDGGVKSSTIAEFCKKATQNLLKGRESQKK